MSSEIKVANIKHESSSSNNLVLASNGKASFSTGISNAGTIDAGTFNGTIGDSVTLSQGTWTPTFTDTSGTDLVTTYGNRNAVYTRIGNLVFFNVDMKVNQTPAPSSSSNILAMSGLPFFGVSPSSSITASNGYPGGIVSYHQNISSSFAGSYSIHWVLQDTGRTTFYYANGASMASFQRQWLTGTSRMIFAGRYYLADLQS